MTSAHANNRPMPAAVLQGPQHTFQHYADAGFGDDLLPILPHDAVIHPDSPGFDGLMAKRGKVPGRKFRGGWFGFKDWTAYTADPTDFPRWADWGAGIGIQGRRCPALDIDVDDPELADAIHKEAVSTLGAAPVRFGRGSRRILVYAGLGISKRRLAFRRLGDEGTSLPDQGAREPAQAVELLGKGQQYVVEGIHPKTGEPYHWRDGHSPVATGSAGLVTVDATAIDDFLDRVESLLELFGYRVEERSAGTAGNRSVCQDGLLAPSPEAVARALAALPNEASYDEYVKVGMAVKAACGPEHEAEALDLFMGWALKWPENTVEQIEEKWGSFQGPFRVGWDYLSNLADEQGDGTFYGAHEDFDAVALTPAPGQESKGPIISDKVQAVFKRWVWVERLKRLYDLVTGELLDREQFNVRNSHIGDPASSKDSAWAVVTRDGKRLQAVKGVTYRPGQGVFVEEALPGLEGPCVNQWRDPSIDLPASASDADVGPWLEHVAFVLPNPKERMTVLKWLAWIIQNPGLKPNWALVIGSTYEGMGKDLMLEPVRVALGTGNIREITPEELDSQYTWFLARCRLVLVEEMKLSERKATMNRLKPLVAAPPYTLSVNAKFLPQYEIPNIVAAIFFTNVENALAISSQGRRYFVTWNDGSPRDAAYYEGLVAWYRNGGAALAARWLLQLDVSDFKAQGRAPDTNAKTAMVQAGRSVMDELIEDDLRDGEGVFADRLFTVDEVVGYVRDRVKDFRMTNTGVAAVLKRNGCMALGRVALGEPPTGCRQPSTQGRRESTVFGRRGDELEGAPLADIRTAYWAERRSDTSAGSIFTVVPK